MTRTQLEARLARLEDQGERLAAQQRRLGYGEENDSQLYEAELRNEEETSLLRERINRLTTNS